MCYVHKKKDVLNLGEQVLVSRIYGEISEISNSFHILAIKVLELRMVCASITLNH